MKTVRKLLFFEGRLSLPSNDGDKVEQAFRAALCDPDSCAARTTQQRMQVAAPTRRRLQARRAIHAHVDAFHGSELPRKMFVRLAYDADDRKACGAAQHGIGVHGSHGQFCGERCF